MFSLNNSLWNAVAQSVVVSSCGPVSWACYVEYCSSNNCNPVVYTCRWDNAKPCWDFFVIGCPGVELCTNFSIPIPLPKACNGNVIFCPRNGSNCPEDHGSGGGGSW